MRRKDWKFRKLGSCKVEGIRGDLRIILTNESLELVDRGMALKAHLRDIKELSWLDLKHHGLVREALSQFLVWDGLSA